MGTTSCPWLFRNPSVSWIDLPSGFFLQVVFHFVLLFRLLAFKPFLFMPARRLMLDQKKKRRREESGKKSSCNVETLTMERLLNFFEFFLLVSPSSGLLVHFRFSARRLQQLQERRWDKRRKLAEDKMREDKEITC